MPNVPTIPETVTVHLGRPDQAAPNVTVTFPDYIKNVASSEIYPTWPDEAIRANILAEISFALNRVYTEYYRNQGYDFDITSSTAADQSFVYGREIYGNISETVDGIFNSYIRRRGFVEPLFAVYCDGIEVSCDGLSQWGTVSLAKDGLSAMEILKTYFGDDIELVTNVPVGFSGSAPLVPLREGAAGPYVETLQTRLNRISANYPLIPKIYPANGFFGQTTENAVKAFQSAFDLTPDGIVGPATWYRIQNVYVGVKRLSDLNSEGLTFEEITTSLPKTLSRGDTGELVFNVQYYLSYIGEFIDSI
ncbi:MAG: peptidoglycan-binding protein, partial [Clostridia bacterium]|nr:peptidoglycan-binding protein [Clostridia bacterium]